MSGDDHFIRPDNDPQDDPIPQFLDRMAERAAAFEAIADRNEASHYEEIIESGKATRLLAADIWRAIEIIKASGHR